MTIKRWDWDRNAWDGTEKNIFSWDGTGTQIEKKLGWDISY